MECYFWAKNGSSSGYLRRISQWWEEQGERWIVTGQRLADQARMIRFQGLLLKLVLEEIERRVLKGDFEPKGEDIDEENCDKVNQNVDQQFDEPRVNCAKHDDVELTTEQETPVENIKHTYNQILIKGKCALKNKIYSK